MNSSGKWENFILLLAGKPNVVLPTASLFGHVLTTDIHGVLPDSGGLCIRHNIFHLICLFIEYLFAYRKSSIPFHRDQLAGRCCERPPGTDRGSESPAPRSWPGSDDQCGYCRIAASFTYIHETQGNSSDTLPNIKSVKVQSSYAQSLDPIRNERIRKGIKVTDIAATLQLCKRCNSRKPESTKTTGDQKTVEELKARRTMNFTAFICKKISLKIIEE